MIKSRKALHTTLLTGRFTCMICFLFLSQKTLAQTPEHFKKVDQVIWVVEDIESVINHWQKLGFNEIIHYGTTQAKFKKENKQATLQMAKANLGGLHVTWIAPQKQATVFSEILGNYGEGIMSLVHRMAHKQGMEKEIDRLAEAGIDVLEQITIQTPKGNLSYVLMATREKGKYSLGYTYGNTDKTVFEGLSEDNAYNLTFNQYAFAIRGIEPASSYWQKAGLPEFSVSQGPVREKRYYGQPADYGLKQGWQNHAEVTYEWCIPLASPNVYEDHMEKHGEGFHHIGFNVNKMDHVMDQYKAMGYEVSMSGAWGEKGKPGSGRFAYIDLEQAGGVAMELLWHYTDE